MSVTAADELRRVWGGVRVDDVCAVDRALRTGVEINRSPVETASYVFASDAPLRRVAAGRRNLPGVFVDVLAGDSNEGVVVALLRAHADRVGDEALAEVIRWRRLRVTRVLVENRLLTDWQISVMGIDLMRDPEDYERMRPWERESAGPFEKGDALVVRALQARLDAGDPVSGGTLEGLVKRHGGRVAMWCVKHADDYALSDAMLTAVRVNRPWRTVTCSAWTSANILSMWIRGEVKRHQAKSERRNASTRTTGKPYRKKAPAAPIAD